jgi:hypothetical protein
MMEEITPQEAALLSKMALVPLTPAPRDLEAESEEAVRKAKQELGSPDLRRFAEIATGAKSRPFRTEPRNAAENLAMQEVSFVGTHESQQYRERVVPAYPQAQQSRKPITGVAEGADFSEWV